MGLWILQQCKQNWNKTNPDLDYNTIMTMAENAKPFFAVLDPDASDFFNPENMCEAICTYLKKTGQPGLSPGDIGQISRIVYESLALKYRNVLERIQKTAHKTVDTIHVVGGGGKDRLLNSFIASAAALPVKAGPPEGTAMGNLLLQAYGSGDLSSIDEIRGVVAASTATSGYTPVEKAPWEEAYRRFSALLA